MGRHGRGDEERVPHGLSTVKESKVSAVKENLIYDVGLHKGEDTDFYLRVFLKTTDRPHFSRRISRI
jgi:hypothetical protein